MKKCRYCGQELPERRMGMELTPTQGRIFDLVQRAGEEGIYSRVLQDRLGMRRETLKSHVYHLNGELQLHNLQVCGRAGRIGVYRLVEIPESTGPDHRRDPRPPGGPLIAPPGVSG